MYLGNLERMKWMFCSNRSTVQSNVELFQLLLLGKKCIVHLCVISSIIFFQEKFLNHGRSHNRCCLSTIWYWSSHIDFILYHWNQSQWCRSRAARDTTSIKKIILEFYGFSQFHINNSYCVFTSKNTIWIQPKTGSKCNNEPFKLSPHLETQTIYECIFILRISS